MKKKTNPVNSKNKKKAAFLPNFLPPLAIGGGDPQKNEWKMNEKWMKNELKMNDMHKS